MSALLKSPIDQKCQAYGLRGCPELVDGAIAYAEGDKNGALEKLEAARKANTPAQLQQFAGALKSLGSLSPEAAAPLLDVAEILSPSARTSVATSAAVRVVFSTEGVAQHANPLETGEAVDVGKVGEPAEGSAGVTATEPALLALSASVDPMRLVTETMMVEGDTPNCHLLGVPAMCSKRREGPLVVTDIVASSACKDRVFLMATSSDSPGFGYLWIVPSQYPGIHAARFATRGGEWLFVGARAAEKPSGTEAPCFVTWAGFRPRFVR